MQLSFMCVCMYLRQRLRIMVNRIENLSRVFQKQKRKKTHEEIEFLLPFTSCRKVLGEMAGPLALI